MGSTNLKTCLFEFDMTWSLFNVNKSHILTSKKIVIPHENSNIEWYLLYWVDIFQNKNIPPSNNKYLSLVVISENQIKVDYKCTLQDSDGKYLTPKLAQNCKILVENPVKDITFFEITENDSYFTIDNLIVKCWIKIEICTFNEITCQHSSNSNKQLLDNFNNLLNSGSFSDVILETNDGTKISAHKCILGAQSPVFAAMFQHDMIENKENKVIIGDVDADVLKAMLEFIYSHKFNKNHSKMDQLFIASNKYQNNDLKLMCEIELCKQLSVDNVADYLILGHCHEGEHLKTKALAFIKSNKKEIITKDILKNLEMKKLGLCYDIIKCLASE